MTTPDFTGDINQQIAFVQQQMALVMQSQSNDIDGRQNRMAELTQLTELLMKLMAIRNIQTGMFTPRLAARDNPTF